MAGYFMDEVIFYAGYTYIPVYMYILHECQVVEMNG